MARMRSVRGSWLLSLILAIGVSLPAAAGVTFPVKIGMREEEVVRVLGEPERKAILEGKVLRELKGGAVPPKHRNAMLVFLYDRRNVRVWFRHGSVTDVTQNGVSVVR